MTGRPRLAGDHNDILCLGSNQHVSIAVQQGWLLAHHWVAVFSFYYLLIVPIGIGFLSHAYRHFFQAPLELPWKHQQATTLTTRREAGRMRWPPLRGGG